MHEPVLVLNANFEPINVCTTRRAVGLLLAGKADLVVNGRGHIRTVKQLLPRPSVIRLEAQVHRPRPHVKLTRREVVAGCAWLGAAIDEEANGAGQGRIDSSASSIPIWVLPTDEERVIARHTAAVLGKAPVSEAEPLQVEVPPVHG